MKETNNRITVLCDMGVGGQRGRVFSTGGVIGALSATDYKDPPKVLTFSKEDERDMIREQNRNK